MFESTGCGCSRCATPHSIKSESVANFGFSNRAREQSSTSPENGFRRKDKHINLNDNFEAR